jgi:hypothetical protein
VALAQERAATIGMGERTRFQVGDLAATSLVDGSCDAAMSLDVLLFVPDQADVTFGRWGPDCLAGHIGFEPANPSARYLIGIA